MRSKQEIQKKLADVLAAPQFSYPSASISVNAPLALIQLTLETKRYILNWVLEESEAVKEVQDAEV